MSKFEGWFCDTCGDIIKKAEDGWMEWIEFEDIKGKQKGRNLRLVHHKPASPKKSEHGCQFNGDYEFRKDRGVIHDLSLRDFLGPNSLMFLLSLVAENRLPIQEVLEMIKRLHIPGYEHARFHFDRAISEGVFEPNTLKGYYWQSDINAILKYIEKM
ncbi:MAG: hypothetical protein HZB79_11115 [Deltaproteobacteria bacterium]|nr:hypothetical protein [Deltaproteobacteria bacterium]